MKQLTLILLLTASTFLFGQNLVPNPSFENVHGIPNWPSQLDSAIGWSSWGGTADLYSTFSHPSTLVNIPYAFGYQHSKHGDYYVGAYFMNRYNWAREAIGVTLSSPLQIGETYKVSFYVSLAGIDSTYLDAAINKIGVLFTNSSYALPSWNNSIDTAHVFSSTVISDTSGWTNIQGTFIADSAYQYMGIGNFFQQNKVTVVDYYPNSLIDTAAYYFVDSVSVYKVIETGISKNEKGSFRLSPNPTTSDLSISFEELNTGSLRVLNSLGQVVFERSFEATRALNISIDGPSGLYFLQLEIDGELISKKVIKK